MRVDCGDRNRALPQVVLLVDVLVDPLAVHQSVRVVKAELLDQYANADLEEHPVESGQLANVGHSAQLHYVEREDRERDADEDLITDDADDNFDQLHCVDGLVRVRLDLVASQELRSIGQVHNGINRAEHPVDHECICRRPPHHQVELIIT